MANSIFGVLGILLYIWACNNIFKIYKKMHIFHKILVCAGLFVGCMILATIFLLIILPDKSPENVADKSFMFMGLFADVASLITVFLFAQKNYDLNSKEYKSARNNLIITGGFLLVLMFYMFFSLNF